MLSGSYADHMEDLPSYQDAIRRKDWLDVVAPYALISDYHNLCLVSRRFYNRFAPRLWKDPIRMIRELGLSRDNGKSWLGPRIEADPIADFLPTQDHHWFMTFKHCVMVLREGTRELVAIVDYRNFVAGAGGRNGFYSGGLKILEILPNQFPNLRCLLLDGHPEFDPVLLQKFLVPTQLKELNFLSMAYHRTELPARFFDRQCMSTLVYLDLSDMPGPLRGQLQQEYLTPRNLPMLRVFRARGKEMDDATATLLFRTFKTQLWSLDLSHNNLTDRALSHFTSECAPGYSLGFGLRSDAHFGAEGKLTLPTRAGSFSYGPYYFIKESNCSDSFSSPERHHADAPVYANTADLPAQEGTVVRTDGRGRVMGDSADDIKRALTGGLDDAIPDSSYLNRLEVCQRRHGVTHLHLNELNLSSAAIQCLIRTSPGHLEHFECDSTTFSVNQKQLPTWLTKSIRLYGFPGGAYLFRPVICSNLRVLRIHHSLVTNIPTLKTEDLAEMANLWLAEACFRERMDYAYPQTFISDMNPRLYSLVLTKIPRYSTGVVADRLIEFLKLAAIQEKSIADATTSARYRAPIMLKGLRHIRLEFEPNPKEDMDDLSDSDVEDLDPEELINLAAKEFSFFGENGWSSSKPEEARRESLRSTQTTAASSTTTTNKSALSEESGRLTCRPFNQAQGEHIEYTGMWNMEDFSIPVWIGSGDPSTPYPAVNEYMRNVCDTRLRSDVIPASPCHVAAGVPAGSYIFNGAWEAMLTPKEVRRPTKDDLKGMHDVIDALRTFRLQTKAAYAAAQEGAARKEAPSYEPHFHWTGKLEVAT